MTQAAIVSILAGVVGGLLFLNRQQSCAFLFKYLPLPLWCYALPLILATAGFLPQDQAIYRKLSDTLLPLALGLLLLSVDLGAVSRLGKQAVIAAAVGAAGILAGTIFGVVIFRPWLPADSWKGAAALSATWTGGTMNLLAIRSLLEVPKEVFAPLIIVDAAVAYSWMALLILLAGKQEAINRWFNAENLRIQPAAENSSRKTPASSRLRLFLSFAFFAGCVFGVQKLAAHLPTSFLITSASGWTVLIISLLAMLGSCSASLRALGGQTDKTGYACLYFVLAMTGAQANLRALWATPGWLLVGVSAVTIHGLGLLIAGKTLRLPMGLLATASQANIGGVVSAPMVAAIYGQSLAPIGLVLAMAENGLGTYLGLMAAGVCRFLMQG